MPQVRKTGKTGKIGKTGGKPPISQVKPKPASKRAGDYSDNKIRLAEDVLAITGAIAARFGFEAPRPIVEAIFRSQVDEWRRTSTDKIEPLATVATVDRGQKRKGKPHESKIRIAPDILDRAIAISEELGLNSHRAVIEAVIRSRHQEWLKSFAQSANTIAA